MHFLNRATAATVFTAFLITTLFSSAPASEVDSWGGQVFLRHSTDVLAWPHRALEFSNTASLVYVPPTTSSSDFPVTRAVDPDDLQDVAGVLTIGKENWQGIIGANAPHSFNALMYHGHGPSRGWARGLAGGGMTERVLTLGMDFSDANPTPKMQIGGAYQVNEDARVGVVVQQFSHVWTEVTKDDGEPAETNGFDITGLSFNLSGSLGDLGPLSRIEAALAFGSSERDEFRPIAAADSAPSFGPHGGSGEASTFSVAGTGTMERPDWISTRLPLDFSLYARYDKTTSDYTFEQDADDVTPRATADYEADGIDLRAGFSHQNSNDFATSVGFVTYKVTDTIADVYTAGKLTIVDEVDIQIFPYCDCAGTVEIGKGFSVLWGLMAGWETSETTHRLTDVPTVGDTFAESTVEKDENVVVGYSVGGRYKVNEHFRIAATFNTENLGNPGAIVFGDSAGPSGTSRDVPLTALEAILNF